MAATGRIERMWVDAQEWGLEWLDRLAERRGRRIAAHLEVGLRGERAAFFELRRRGYVVVAQRWMSAKVRGDADLVAWEGETLCFVEVKTRSARTMTPADTAIDEDKRETLRRIARAYLQTFPESERQGIAVRFDVVSVYWLTEGPEIEVSAGAFGWR